MIQRYRELAPSGADMAAAVVVGHALSRPEHLPLYAPTLAGRSNSELALKDRYISLPGRSVGSLEECYSEYIEPGLLRAHQRLEERMVLVGHSMGGWAVTRFGLEHPDKTAAVICEVGAQDGIPHETPATFVIGKLLGDPVAKEEIRHGSDFMVRHRRRIATEWSPQTSLHLIVSTGDAVVRTPHGLGLELPGDQEPDRRYIAMPFPGVLFLARQIPGIPKDVQLLPSLTLAGHMDTPLCLSAIAYTRQVRRAVAQNKNAGETPIVANSIAAAA